MHKRLRVFKLLTLFSINQFIKENYKNKTPKRSMNQVFFLKSSLWNPLKLQIQNHKKPIKNKQIILFSMTRNTSIFSENNHICFYFINRLCINKKRKN